MKTTIITTLAVLCICGPLVQAKGQPTNVMLVQNEPAAMTNQPVMAGPPNESEAQPAPEQNATPEQETAPAQMNQAATEENQPVTSTVILPKGNAPETVASIFVPPAQAVGTNSNSLDLNFNHAPLDMVLNYLSDAAGFVIVQETHVSGTISVVGKNLTRSEAVDLLNTELNQNGYAAILDGRTLTIMDKNQAKTQNIPVKTGNNPDEIPDNDQIATWIIPIRFVEARQLVSDLSSFVSSQATIVANDAGNSIVVTDTQANIRHLAEIIQAVDNSAEAETEIRVFPLKFANPNDVANELGNIFPSSTSGNNTQSPVQFRGGGGGGPGGFFARMAAAAAGGSGNSSSDRIKKETQVTAVADSRIQAVIVSAPKDLMDQIASMMTALDVPSDRDQGVYVYQMKNGDPMQAVQVLQSMFSNGNTSRGGSSSSSSTESALQQRANNNTMGTSSSTTSTGVGGGSSGIGGGGGGRTY